MKHFVLFFFVLTSLTSWAKKSKDCRTYVVIEAATQAESAWYFDKGVKKYPNVCPSDESHRPDYIIKVNPEYTDTEISVPVTTGSSHTTVDLQGTDHTTGMDTTGTGTTMDTTRHTTGTISTTTKGREKQTVTSIMGYAYIYSVITDPATGHLKPSMNPIFAKSRQMGGWSVTSDLKVFEEAVKFLNDKVRN
jgi:hypothetical protein